MKGIFCGKSIDIGTMHTLGEEHTNLLSDNDGHPNLDGNLKLTNC